MNWVNSLLGSNIGRKLSMALTGLFLISFLLVHLSGNFLLLNDDQGEKFNVYSRFMSTAGIIRVLEIGLVLGFLIHMYIAFVLTRRNASSRPKGYAAGNNTPGVSWFSKNMGLTGSLILAFLVIHLKTFYFGYHSDDIRQIYYKEIQQNELNHTVQGYVLQAGQIPPVGTSVYKDMTELAHRAFAQPWYVGLYLITFVILAFHLAHGFQSAFQTLGLEHKKYTPIVRGLGWIIAIALPLGFASIPVLLNVLHLQIP